jgi:hypothetical protein
VNWWEEAPTVEQALKAAPVAPAGAAPSREYKDDPEWWKNAPELRAMPPGTRMPGPIRDRLDTGLPTGALARASLATDTETEIKRLSQSTGIPEKRFGVIDGNIVYTDEEGQTHRVRPSVFGGDRSEGVLPYLWETLQRGARYVAGGAGPAIPQTAGMATGVAMGPTGLSIPAVAGAAGVADLGRQALDKAMAGESVMEGYDLLNAGGHALMAGGGQAGGYLFNKAMNRNPMGVSQYDRAQAMSPQARQAAADLEAEARRRGVDLSAGQATDLRSLKVNERRLGRFDETADRVYDFARNQRETQVPAAVRQEIAAISPKSGEAAVQSFREGAEGVVEKAMAERAKAASSLYDEAFKANQNVQSPAIDRLLRTPAGRQALRNAATKMQNDMTLVGVPDKELTEQARYVASLGQDKAPPRQGVASGLKLRTLDYVKRSLDDMSESAMRAGEKDNARIIGNLKRSLVAELDKLDVTAQAGPNSVNPAGGAYARARAAYGSGSDALDRILEGGTGFINKMEGMDRQSIVNRAFSAQNIMPEEVARVRSQFAMAGKMDDFNAGVASWLSDRLADAMKANASGGGNVPGKVFASVWGDERQRAILKAALGDQARVDSMGQLMKVLQAAARSLPEGSPTATDLPSMSGVQTVGKVGQVFGKIFSPGAWLNVGEELVKGVDALRTPAARQRLADALLSGKYDQQLSKLRMLSPTGERAAVIASQVLTDLGITKGVGSMFQPNDRLPEGVAATQ